MLSYNEDSTFYSKLNDIGICLLEKNCFQQAMDTYREAAKVAKKNSRLSPEDKEQLVRNAQDRLENLEQFPKPPSMNYSRLKLETLAHAGSIDNILDKIEAATEDGDLEHYYLSIWIGDPSRSNISIDLALALIQYNSGIANQAFAGVLYEKKRRIAFSNCRRAASKQLRKSDKILEQLINPSTTGAKFSEPKEARQVLFVHLVVLLALHNYALGHEEADEIREKLIDLNTKIDSMSMVLEMSKLSASRLTSLRRNSMVGPSSCGTARSA